MDDVEFLQDLNAQTTDSTIPKAHDEGLRLLLLGPGRSIMRIDQNIRIHKLAGRISAHAKIPRLLDISFRSRIRTGFHLQQFFRQGERDVLFYHEIHPQNRPIAPTRIYVHTVRRLRLTRNTKKYVTRNSRCVIDSATSYESRF